jgi:N-acyl-D-amino-acid deacylase
MNPVLNRVCQLLLTSIVLMSCSSEHGEQTGKGQTADEGVVPASWLMTNVRIIDGSGSAPYSGAVRIEGAKITDTGNLTPLQGEKVIDGQGRILAPGFIDTHSHADRGLFEQREALAAVSQGITTIIVGQDGGSQLPLASFFERYQASPSTVNVASYAGHGAIRAEVMGEDYRRPATEAEINAMGLLLQQELDAGALGLGAGLEYDPGIYSESAEVIALAKIAAASNGRYISHMRSEDRALLSAIEEIIEIGRQTGMPVQISHFKLAMISLWGTAADVLARLDAARAEGINITADIYPYEFWQSGLTVLLPERDFNDRTAFEFALTELAPPETMYLSLFEPQPEYVGKSISDVAHLRNVDPTTAYMQLVAESEAWSAESGEPSASIIAKSMHIDDIKTLFGWAHTNLCTDGALVDLHPRGAGSFTRVLGRYVRVDGLMPLELAVHKMTGLAALHMGLTDRGLIRPGSFADLVLFDPETVIDNATPDQPDALSTGILGVWVNGTPVYRDGEATGQYPGAVIKRPGT